MLAYTIPYINDAKKIAKEYKNEFITPEHVMCAIIRRKDISLNVLTTAGIDVNTLDADMVNYFKENALSKEVEPQYSDGLLTALVNLDKKAEDQKAVTLLDFILELKNAGSDYLFNSIDAQNSDFDTYITDMDQAIKDVAYTDENKGKQSNFNEVSNNSDIPVALIKIVQNADDIRGWFKDVDKIEYRPEYANRLRRCISNRAKSNALLYGDENTNKDEIIGRFLMDAYENTDVNIIMLDMARIMANAMILNQASSVIDSIFGAFRKISGGDDSAPNILYIKNLDMLYEGNGVVSDALSSIMFDNTDGIHIVAAISREGYEDLKEVEYIESNTKFIEVTQPDDDQLYSIINDYYIESINGYEEGSIAIPNESIGQIIESIISIVDKYYPNNKLSAAKDMVDDLILDIGSYNIADEEVHKDTYEQNKREINASIASILISDKIDENTDLNKYIPKKITNKVFLDRFQELHPEIKDFKISSKVEINKLEPVLKSQIFGQDKAIDTIVNSIKRSYNGFKLPNKPIGSYIFIGPTGVGKTQLAKSLSEALGYELIRFNMSEYKERFDVTKLIGAPPGYVGYESGGALVTSVRKNPKSIILLDEIEKADSSIYDVLLQIMDDAMLTDGKNNTADFSDTIIIMTSNAGAEDYMTRSIGFGASDVHTNALSNALKNTFKPEFLGRVSNVVEFNRLTPDIYNDIIKKDLNIWIDTLYENNGMKLSYDDNVVEYIQKNVDTATKGARDIEHFIAQNVINCASDAMLKNNDDNKKHLRLKVDTTGELICKIFK